MGGALMASLIPSGSASGTGSMTLAAPVTNSNQTATLPDATGTVMVSGNMPAFSVYQNADQSITANTWTKLNFQVENFDTNNNFASNRFTPTVAGYYQINLNCSMASTTATQFMFINPFKNGSSYVVGNISIPLSGVTYARATVSTLMYLNGTTDYVEGYAYFSANNLTAASSDGVQFSGSLVRTA